VITAAARERITAAIVAATGAARLLTSPNRPVPDDGYFVAPHVVELPDAGVPVWREEVFGPLLTLIRAGTADEAFTLAEDSEYGLSCSVFTNDLGRVTAAMDRIRVGVLHVNSETGGADPHVPFGGAKGSGYGPKEQGRAAREFFTYPQTTYLRATV
jgi:aldehyde dehydrogenase (NAD+)